MGKPPSSLRQILYLGLLSSFGMSPLGAQSGTVSVPQELVQYADVVIKNGKVVTVDENFAIVQAVVIRDGKIIAVGSNAQADRYAGPDTRIVDVQGRTVLPGLVDTHSHPHENGLDHYASQAVPELRRQVVEGSNFEDFLVGIRDIAEKVNSDEWVLVNLQPAELANSFWLKHTYRDLDKVAKDKLILVDQGVRGLTTSAGLEAFKERYGFESELMKLRALLDENGQMAGRFRAEVVRVFKADVVLENRMGVLQDTYYRELQDLAKYGVTTWASTLQPIQAFQVFSELDRQGRMAVRLAYVHAAGFTSFPHAAGFYERLGPIQGHGTDFLWNIGAGPGNIDGAYPNVCMSLDAPASIKEREQCFAGPGEFKSEAMAAIVRTGGRIANNHVSGDLALDHMMDIIEEASREAGFTAEQVRAKRHATDHCDYNPRPDQIERAIGLGLYFSCKNNTIYRGGAVRFLADYGEQYEHMLSPVNSILKAGGKAVIELDHHLTDELNPFYDLQIWITREYQGRVIGPDERVDRKTAIQMLTRWASEYVLREDVLGSLEQGKWADLIVLDKDYLTIPEDQIKDIDVLLTLVAGKPVYVSSSFQAQVAPLGN